MLVQVTPRLGWIFYDRMVTSFLHNYRLSCLRQRDEVDRFLSKLHCALSNLQLEAVGRQVQLQ